MLFDILRVSQIRISIDDTHCDTLGFTSIFNSGLYQPLQCGDQASRPLAACPKSVAFQTTNNSNFELRLTKGAAAETWNNGHSVWNTPLSSYYMLLHPTY